MNRNKSLDLLRTLAVVLVLFRHMTPECPRDYPALIRVPFDMLANAGWCGVDLFFVLSGFLVSGLLFKEHQQHGAVRVGRFYVRRGLKIYPAFYVFFVLYALAEWRLTHPALEKFLYEATFIQNYTGGAWNHTWSLAVEEHFYIFIGLLIALLARRRWLAAFPAVAAVLLPAILIARTVIMLVFHGYVLYPTHLRMDGLLFGVLLSWLHHYRPSTLAWARGRLRWLWLVLALAALTPLLFLALDDGYVATLGLTVNYLAFGVILLVVHGAAPELERSRLVRWLAMLGVHSYSVYLWHMPVKRFFSMLRRWSFIELPWPIELLLFIATAFAVGVVMAKLVERPVLALRDRWFPTRSTERTIESGGVASDLAPSG